MSVVTGFTFQYGNNYDIKTMARIAEWLLNHNFQVPIELSNRAGGSKHPQISIWIAGYNYFPEDDFITFFKTLSSEWTEPETVVLILNPEEGAAKVVLGTDK